MASPNLSEIISTTLRSRTGALADNITQNNAILFRLKERGRIKPVSGGRTIVQELAYQENATFMYYSGYETLNIAASDTITAAEFDWKQAAVAVTVSGLEADVQNTGKEALIDLVESRIENAEATMSNNIAEGLRSDGTGTGGKQIGGLQHLVADTPTNTVGGIDRSTYTFFKNVSYDATTDGGAAATAANIQGYMNDVYVQLVRNNDRPDLILADNNYWTLYLESLQAIQRITNDKMGQAGFMNIKYMDADVVLDGGYQNGSGGIPTNHMYFLNTKYIHYRPHRERNMVELNADRYATNQDAVVKLIGWAGNMTMSCGFLQGVLKD